jgi:ribulose-5-phosphate 4-epimerase/fuculose-1-phosphate aldolase
MTAPFHAVALRGSSRPHPAKLESVIPPAAGGPPPTQTIEEIRLYRKQRLAAGFRIFARCGFALGDAGHITVRDPEFPDCFWVNPSGVHFSRIRVSNLMLVNGQNEVLQLPKDGPAKVDPAAFAIHSELYKARPDVLSAAHAHSIHGMAWSSMGRLLDPLTQDAAAFYEDHVVFEDFSGVVLDVSEGARIAQALGAKHAAILQNHGLLTLGAAVESTIWRFVAMDACCHVQLLADAAGRTRPMPAEVAKLTQPQIGSELACLHAFEPYWSVVTDEEPDLFD